MKKHRVFRIRSDSFSGVLDGFVSSTFVPFLCPRLNGDWPGVGVPMYGHPNYASWFGFSMSSRQGCTFFFGCVQNTEV